MLATDHRAVVLESVATQSFPTISSIIHDCTSHDFTEKNVKTMLWQLVREGLIIKVGSHFMITQSGLDWLRHGRFTRALPAPHTRTRRKSA